MASHSDEYRIANQKLKKYYNNDLENDEIIEAKKNSVDDKKRTNITLLVNQRDGQRKLFLNSIEEYDKIKNSIEAEAKSKNKEIDFSENISEENSGTVIAEEREKESESETNDDDSKKELESLEEKAKELESIGQDLLVSEESVYKLKSVMMKEDFDAGIILEARYNYEKAKDDFTLTTAQYLVKKNVLVAKREAIIFEINKAIGRGDDLTDLQENLIDLNNQITDLDKNFETILPVLQNEMSASYENLKNSSKEVVDNAKESFRNSYKRVRNYNDDGILKNEKLDMTKDLNRFAVSTSYSDNILTDGKNKSVSKETININGTVVKVITNEFSGNVNTSFITENTEQFGVGIGNNNYVTRDENGNYIADNPQLEETLNKIGINSTEDIAEACEEMKEKSEERDEEEIDGDMEYQDRSLYYNSEE